MHAFLSQGDGNPLRATCANNTQTLRENNTNTARAPQNRDRSITAMLRERYTQPIHTHSTEALSLRRTLNKLGVSARYGSATLRSHVDTVTISNMQRRPGDVNWALWKPQHRTRPR